MDGSVLFASICRMWLIQFSNIKKCLILDVGKGIALVLWQHLRISLSIHMNLTMRAIFVVGTSSTFNKPVTCSRILRYIQVIIRFSFREVTFRVNISVFCNSEMFVWLPSLSSNLR